MIFIIPFVCFSQKEKSDKQNSENNIIEGIIEYIAENTDEEIDYSDIVGNLYDFLEHPLNINSATEDDLKQLYFLNDFQISSLLGYIINYGAIVSKYELLYVDGFTEETMKMMLPFICFKKPVTEKKISFKNVFKYGRNRIFVRYSQILEKQAGYADAIDSVYENKPNMRFLGGPEKIYTHYDFNYFNKIKFGFTAEKDPGEIFFKKNKKKFIDAKVQNGFDFYSGYIFAKDIGIIKKIALGNYHLQFGQGLTLWSGLAFGKTPDAVSIKRYAQGIKPNNSANETNYFKGMAITSEYKNFEFSTFFSKRKLDANIIEKDSLDKVLSVSTFQHTGYHRLPSEIYDKNSVYEKLFGGNIKYKKRKIKLGLTFYKTDYNANVIPYDKPSYLFNFKGNDNFNAGIDFDYLIKKFNFFGEISLSENKGLAYLTGMVTSLNPGFLLSVIYRNFRRNYQNLYANAFSVSSCSNEKALYLGVNIGLTRKINIKAYCDNYSFPWIKYRIYAPSEGYEIFTQIDFKLSNDVKMFFRYRQKNKKLNFNDELLPINLPLNDKLISFRYNISYSVLPFLELKNRIEYVDHKYNDNTGNGFMMYQDVIFKPLNKPFSLTMRYALFDTDTYDERIYAYENDVLYSFSFPSYFYKGSRFYILLHYKIFQNLDVWTRFAQTYYSNKDIISTGLNQINGNKKTEFKLQLRYKY